MSRFPHTMLRVGDLQRSVDFYTKAFGMKELRRRDVPDGKYTLAFVGYGDEESNTAIELTYNYGVDKYEMGGAFGHLAVGVPDVAAELDVLTNTLHKAIHAGRLPGARRDLVPRRRHNVITAARRLDRSLGRRPADISLGEPVHRRTVAVCRACCRDGGAGNAANRSKRHAPENRRDRQTSVRRTSAVAKPAVAKPALAKLARTRICGRGVLAAA